MVVDHKKGKTKGQQKAKNIPKKQGGAAAFCKIGYVVGHEGKKGSSDDKGGCQFK